MKSCLHCEYADWNITSKGNLHPSGDGTCRYEYKIMPLPASMHWGSAWRIYGYGSEPTPLGGFINRREELKLDCVYWVKKGELK